MVATYHRRMPERAEPTTSRGLLATALAWQWSRVVGQPDDAA
jgi:hypothetical protein